MWDFGRLGFDFLRRQNEGRKEGRKEGEKTPETGKASFWGGDRKGDREEEGGYDGFLKSRVRRRGQSPEAVVKKGPRQGTERWRGLLNLIGLCN